MEEENKYDLKLLEALEALEKRMIESWRKEGLTDDEIEELIERYL